MGVQDERDKSEDFNNLGSELAVSHGIAEAARQQQGCATTQLQMVSKCSTKNIKLTFAF